MLTAKESTPVPSQSVIPSGDTVEYKFYLTGESGVGYEGLTYNRTLTLGADGVNATLPTAYFNNDDGIGPVISIIGGNSRSNLISGRYVHGSWCDGDRLDRWRCRLVMPIRHGEYGRGEYLHDHLQRQRRTPGNAGTPVMRNVVVAEPVQTTFDQCLPRS